MTTATTLRLATPSDAAAIARLHAREISEGFLSVLGQPFLARLYARVAARSGSFALVTTDDDAMVTGFIAVAESTGGLYRDFLIHDGLQAGLRAAPALLRHPARALETLRHGLVNHGAEMEGAEILALAVSSTARGAGLGRALVEGSIAEMRRRGIARAHVVTASDNAAARRTYGGCGFEPETTIEVHRGAVQEVLVWR